MQTYKKNFFTFIKNFGQPINWTKIYINFNTSGKNFQRKIGTKPCKEILILFLEAAALSVDGIT
jgi:hypothetical protein